MIRLVNPFPTMFDCAQFAKRRAAARPSCFSGVDD